MAVQPLHWGLVPKMSGICHKTRPLVEASSLRWYIGVGSVPQIPICPLDVDLCRC